MTYRQIFHGVPTRDAAAVMAYVLDISVARALATLDEVCTDLSMSDWAKRLRDGEPLAYLLRRCDFFGLSLYVDERVLIPRPDSEAVVDAALAALSDIPNPRVLDLCCGSGCLGLAVLSKRDDATLVGADVSPRALDVARNNAASLSHRADFIAANALSAPPDDIGRFNVMVCNPPYVTAAEMATLDRSVLDYEPHIALLGDVNGGTDGMDFYRAIWRLWSPVADLTVFECAFAQAAPLRALTADGSCIVVATGADAYDIG